MPPESDGANIRTVGCNLEKLIPDKKHLDKIKDAVDRVHRATFYATELLNIHLRVQLRDGKCLKQFFQANWILNAFNEVTSINGTPRVHVDENLRESVRLMPSFEPPSRGGIQQCILYECKNIVTVASNNVWMHFQKRVLTHVRARLHIERDEFLKLDEASRRAHKLEVLQVSSDVCRNTKKPYTSPQKYHEWIEWERKHLGIDDAVREWGDKPLLYHLKTKPHSFIRSLFVMSKESEDRGGKSFALFPLRRTFVPRHSRFDQKALRDLLSLGASEHSKKRKRGDESKRRNKKEMKDEKGELFNRVLNLRAANVQQRWQFDYAFTTDGVCARVQMSKPLQKKGTLETTPRRGIWAIDELKRVSKLEELHVVGVDPGKHELVVCVDKENTKHIIRYTQRERLRDIRSRQYKSELETSKPFDVLEAERELTGFNSRSTNLDTFCNYCKKRHENANILFAFYRGVEHRRRRWKVSIKTQQSEEKLYTRLKGIQKMDSRPIVLAYGSWGLIAGKVGSKCNKGLPPCIGVGLLRKLSKHFIVSPTPEAYTSKTCNKCLGECGRWKEMEGKKEIRGLRRCQQRECMVPLNRDKNAAINIATNFMRLFCDRPPIRTQSKEDIAFHKASLCFDCS